MIWVRVGSVLMALAVLAGAFGAHALKTRIDPAMMDVYKTAVLYHMIHALALVFVGIMAQAHARSSHSAIFFLIGILLFSGSLYLLSITGIRWLGAVTPLGGVSFIAAWVLLALGI